MNQHIVNLLFPLLGIQLYFKFRGFLLHWCLFFVVAFFKKLCYLYSWVWLCSNLLLFTCSARLLERS